MQRAPEPHPSRHLAARVFMPWFEDTDLSTGSWYSKLSADSTFMPLISSPGIVLGMALVRACAHEAGPRTCVFMCRHYIRMGRCIDAMP